MNISKETINKIFNQIALLEERVEKLEALESLLVNKSADNLLKLNEIETKLEENTQKSSKEGK